jgi:hypothetical protein
LGARWWETAGVWVEASESSVRSRWAGRLCRATLEGSIKWAAVAHRGRAGRRPLTTAELRSRSRCAPGWRRMAGVAVMRRAPAF